MRRRMEEVEVGRGRRTSPAPHSKFSLCRPPAVAPLPPHPTPLDPASAGPRTQRYERGPPRQAGHVRALLGPAGVWACKRARGGRAAASLGPPSTDLLPPFPHSQGAPHAIRPAAAATRPPVRRSGVRTGACASTRACTVATQNTLRARLPFVRRSLARLSVGLFPRPLCSPSAPHAPSNLSGAQA